MKSIRIRYIRSAVLLLATVGLLSCEEDETAPPTPVLTTINVAVSPTSLAIGQTVTATASGLDQNGDPIAIGTIAWSTGSATVASVTAEGVVTAATAGTTPVIATVGGKTGQVSITVNPHPGIRINEVESNGGTPGDWVELINPTTAPIDISGFKFRDNDATHTFYVVPNGTIVAPGAFYLLEEAQFGFGLGQPDEAGLYNAFGALVEKFSWTTHAAVTFGRCPNGAGELVANSASTKGAVNNCLPNIKINEIESNGGTPGDWIELFNAGTTPVNVGGFFVKDDDNSRTFQIAAGTTIAPGAYLVVEEAQFGFGLGQPDAARLFDPTGVLVDSHSWTTHATTTLGRCPDGSGEFATTLASTKGTANTCATPVAAWPGADDVTTVDVVSTFTSNLSGLTYEAGTGGAPNVLWAALNGPGSVFRMILVGGLWTPDPANGWAAGKAVTYTNGTGQPDAEGITMAGTTSGAGLYVASERDNNNNTVSRNVILRYDPAGTATTMTATHQWDITADLPVVGANLGLEAITYIPDAVLTARSFFDESKNRAYAPADYPDHAGGIFFVGVEGNGIIYAYALNHTNSTFTRVATISTGFVTAAGGSAVMELAFDPATNYLWAVCDDSCNGVLGILEIDVTAGSPTLGRFKAPRLFARPASMPNVNNEGFTLAPASECVNNRKQVFWSDDNDTAGNSLRRATINCGAIAGVGATRQ